MSVNSAETTYIHLRERRSELGGREMKLSWSKILKNKQRESHVTPTRQVDGVICAFTFCIFIEVIFGETGRGYSADTTDYSPWSEDLQE